MHRNGFTIVEFLLTGLIVMLFVGGFFFVFHEPDEAPSEPLSEEKLSLTKKDNLLGSQVPKAEVRVDKVSGSKPAEKIVPPKPAVVSDKVSVAADFGVEGTVFNLTSGMPLEGCRVNFKDDNLVTDQAGNFHLWLEGEVGRLSFSASGFKTLAIQQFDAKAGGGLAYFDVYLNKSEKSGRGRIEVNGVNGRVFDRESGAPLAGAKITIAGLRSVADDAGFFELWGNSSGLVTMTVAARGYVSEMLSGIDFENRNNPFFFEVSLERNQAGKGRLALVGIGARLVKSESGYEIADLLAGSPAALEGLISGDRLVAVDSLAVDDFSLREVVELIRGQAGIPVTLMVEREGDFLEFTCLRERVVY